MDALILAAGVGSRLGHLTAQSPKALVPVLGKPILGYQLEALTQVGVPHINLVIGYCGHLIRDFAKDYAGNRTRFTFRTNEEFKSSNSSYSFWLARDLVQGMPYIHLNCDIVFSADTLRRLLVHEHPDVIVLDKGIKLGDNMEQVKMEGTQIVEMRNMRFNEACGKAVGLAKFSKETVSWVTERLGRYVADGDKMQNFYGILREAVRERDIRGMWAEDAIYEINTLSDLSRVEAVLESNPL